MNQFIIKIRFNSTLIIEAIAYGRVYHHDPCGIGYADDWLIINKSENIDNCKNNLKLYLLNKLDFGKLKTDKIIENIKIEIK
jgi:hypothetical protein